MSIQETAIAAPRLPEDGWFPIADVRVLTPFSIIVPTYKEVENIPLLLSRFAALREAHDLNFEVLFMDDNSQDGGLEAVQNSGYEWARMIVRTTNRGLSPSVIDGFCEAKHPILICMDCDLSHPPEVIPSMLLTLSGGPGMVVGSRYVKGGGTDDNWGFIRWLNSAIATLLARPLTRIKDPMSGFFALRRSDFRAANDLNPVGYKVALELIVKCDIDNAAEIPIFFEDRKFGESKLTFKEQLKYIQHLRRLYMHKFTNAMYLLQFLTVGAAGTLVNLLFLTLSYALGAPPRVALAVGILTSLVFNFALHRRFTFSYARSSPIARQFAGFVAASTIGMIINFLVADFTRTSLFEGSALRLQAAALTGIAAGMTFNFISSRFFVFKARHVRSEQEDRTKGNPGNLGSRIQRILSAFLPKSS